MSSFPALILAVVLLALNGFFVAAEFALLSARRSRLEQLVEDGNPRAAKAVRSLRELTVMLAGAQLGITMASLGLGAVAEPAVARLIESPIEAVVELPSGVLHGISFAIALAVVVFLHMVVGEMAPKSWAIAHPEASALRLITPFRWFTTIFRPLILFLNVAANAVVRVVGIEPKDEVSLAQTKAELLVLLQRSQEHGGIDAEVHRLLSASLELSGRVARDAMTLRRDLVAVAADTSIDEVEEVARKTGRSRILVYEEDLDHIQGFVLTRDLLLLDDELRRHRRAASVVRSLHVTHERHALEDLLVEMRADRQQLAIVVDEHGLVMGLVTLQDVLDELVGEYAHDDAARRIRHRADGSWAVDGGVRPDELDAVTGLTLPEGDWDTVAGFVIAQLDRIPEAGDHVTHDGATFEVRGMDGYSVTEIIVTSQRVDKLESSPADGERVPGSDGIDGA